MASNMIGIRQQSKNVTGIYNVYLYLFIELENCQPTVKFLIGKSFHQITTTFST
ncbi:hypothetical protein C0J52_11595 [Blattella germanica]|nr:hypothetical protein C0J52_11595 [Blattella germanica]